MINPKNSQNKITSHLQQDVVKISGKTILQSFYIGGDLMKIQIDGLELGQMSEEQIETNGNRFYPK